MKHFNSCVLASCVSNDVLFGSMPWARQVVKDSLKHHWLSLYWDCHTNNDVQCLFFHSQCILHKPNFKNLNEELVYMVPLYKLNWHILSVMVSKSPEIWGNCSSKIFCAKLMDSFVNILSSDIVLSSSFDRGNFLLFI